MSNATNNKEVSTLAEELERTALAHLQSTDLGRGPKSLNEAGLKLATVALLLSRHPGLRVHSEMSLGGGKHADLVTDDGARVTIYEFKYIPVQFVLREKGIPPPPANVDGLQYRFWLEKCIQAVEQENAEWPVRRWGVHSFVHGIGGLYTVDQVTEDALHQAVEYARMYDVSGRPNLRSIDVVALVGVGRRVSFREGTVAVRPLLMTHEREK